MKPTNIRRSPIGVLFGFFAFFYLGLVAGMDIAFADGVPATCADDRIGRCSTSTIVNGVCGKMNSMTDTIDNSNATLQKEYKKYLEMLDAAKSGTIDASRRQALVDQQTLLKEARLECAAEIKHCDACSIRHADRDGIDKLLAKSREKIRAGVPALTAKKPADDAEGPTGAKGSSLLTDATDGDESGGTGGTVDPGGSQDSGSKTADKKKESGSGMSSKDMAGIMSAVTAMMAQQNQPKPVVDNSCNGPTPGPYCPPKHACFTNPSSLECKCSEYGPGGPECGRMAALPTERNMGGNKIAENFEEPPAPELTNSGADPGIAGHQAKDKKSSAIPQQGGGGAGINTNNSYGALTARKPPPRRSGGGSSANSGGTSQGYMSSGSVALKGGAANSGNASGGKEKIIKSEFEDPTLQGVKMHYGKMLQAGFESAKRRTAGTQQGIISKELRPASDDIFKAVRDMYQLKLASLLR